MGQIYVSVVEYAVFNYPHPGMAHDPDTGMGGWHYMRIEYHDDEEPYAFDEHHVWMPPSVNSAVLEDWLQVMMDKKENEP